ncbi:membrane-bound lytic murein transglycosylase MltF [Agaribacterium haliotis]|uniref:membrane-bound lytic murein transglycosylase MltF n=1 Tax=Agaribacterium haliotis TaxID=2013869 RepID=UPI000BB53FF6|nr:membrane-bound lytic murein transglycosylase MltF [Agaribacterium haliotis]
MTKKQAHKLAAATLRLVKLCLFSAILVVVSAGLQNDREPNELERVMAKGKLTMVSRNGPTTYFEAANGYSGFEYLLASAFADYLGLELELVDEYDLGTMLANLDRSPGQFAAAGLTVTPARENHVDFAPSYASVTQVLLYRSGSKRPKTFADLQDGRLVVIADSSHEENLHKLKLQHPELEWEVRHDLEMMELMELVQLGEIDYTVVDSNAYDINAALYPKARRAFDISEAQPLAWAFAKKVDRSLIKQAEKFFAEAQTQTMIEDLTEVFYGHVEKIDFAGSLLFTKRMQSRLPKWKAHLQEAAQEQELDWQLLAALSYQESHWNPKAVSYTGVKGFMMLTMDTAKQVGVKNRANAKQSIGGGARYFRSIHKRIPERIAEPDRSWLALAAYNIGMGHLEDARKLTEGHGANPDKWSDVRRYLPLLAKAKYYKYTKHGYARGWEAVDYVQNIRNFYNIIAWHEKVNEQRQLAKLDEEINYSKVSPAVTDAVRTLSTPALEL